MVVSGDSSAFEPATAKVNLLVDIQAKIQARKGPGYERWAKIFNLKQAAQTDAKVGCLTGLGAEPQQAEWSHFDARKNERNEGMACHFYQEFPINSVIRKKELSGTGLTKGIFRI